GDRLGGGGRGASRQGGEPHGGAAAFARGSEEGRGAGRRSRRRQSRRRQGRRIRRETPQDGTRASRGGADGSENELTEGEALDPHREAEARRAPVTDGLADRFGSRDRQQAAEAHEPRQGALPEGGIHQGAGDRLLP